MAKKLHRSESNEKIAGVCAGLADYFDVDVTLVRIAFVALALMGGPGILLYIILWLVLPDESDVFKSKNEDLI